MLERFLAHASSGCSRPWRACNEQPDNALYQTCVAHFSLGPSSETSTYLAHLEVAVQDLF